MPVYQRSVFIPAPIGEVYNFHENPHNIRRVCPKYIEVIAVEANSNANADDQFTLKLKIFGFPVHWRGTWKTVEKPTHLVDIASIFPFRSWRHEHQFEDKASSTLMTDRVTYSLPFGLLGTVLGATIFRLQLIIMFRGRHAATLRYFSSK